MSYSSIAEVIADRVRWARACLSTLVDEARMAGWLEGAPRVVGEDARALGQMITAREAATPPNVDITPLGWLALRLELDARELDALWLLAACELDPAVARLAQAFGTPDCPDLAVLAWQQLVAVATGGTLAAEQIERLAELVLIETSFEPRVPLARRRVRANDRVIELARGELRLDRELARIAEVAPGCAAGELDADLVAALSAKRAPIVVATGPAGSGRATRLRCATDRGTLALCARELASEPTLAERQLRIFAREVRLLGVVPLVRELDVEQTDRSAIIHRGLLRTFRGPVLATAAASPAWIEERPLIVHAIEPSSIDDRRRIWRESLPEASGETIAEIAERYAITPATIRAVSSAMRSVDPAPSAVHEGLRAHLGQQLGQLATRIEVTQTWDDLVLPPDQFEQVVELVARVRHRRQVLESWGFGVKIGKGHGVSALLSGPPGTGKTMVAGLVAGELGLDLYQVDLSRIVSKYIGETEKNLATLFDAAESGHGILLFDEADSLFAKRSEVKSSNDRYANLEVNYLLQRMEQFKGISLLTTNHETAIDDAFRRRLALHVRFPMPDEHQRALLWRAMIPDTAPVEPALDLQRLARDFEMTGGYIKNAVVRAAYLAADGGTPIRTSHLLKAAHLECEAMGRVVFRTAV